MEALHPGTALDRKECLRLLAGETMGRVGVSVDALPAVLPVDFRLVGDDVVFCCTPGAKLRAATDHAVIAFEVDHADSRSHSGWSVLVIGMAHLVVDAEAEERYRAAAVPRWRPDGPNRLVVLGTELISGTRSDPDRPDPPERATA